MKRIFRDITRAALVSVLCAVVFLAACGGPSKKTLRVLSDAGHIALAVASANETLPDDLLANRLITPEQFAIVKRAWPQVRTGLIAFTAGMDTALAAEKPDLALLAPIVAQIVADISTLESLQVPNLQRILAGIQIGLRVVATYFALHVKQARADGKTDKWIVEASGQKWSEQNSSLLNGLVGWSDQHPSNAWVWVKQKGQMVLEPLPFAQVALAGEAIMWEAGS